VVKEVREGQIAINKGVVDPAQSTSLDLGPEFHADAVEETRTEGKEKGVCSMRGVF
jgi:hypothetical protein